MKECSICGIEKDLSEFYSQKKHSKKKGNWIYYNPECKECTKNRTKNWQDENYEHYITEANKRSMKARQNPDKNLYQREQSRKQKDSGYAKEYYLKNKDYFKNYNRERQMNKQHEITDEEWLRCKEYFNNSCAYCELPIEEHYIIYAGKPKKTDFHKEHVDHLGSNKIDNCVPSCASCNYSKWAFEFETWYTEENPNFTYERYNKIIKWLNGGHYVHKKIHR